MNHKIRRFCAIPLYGGLDGTEVKTEPEDGDFSNSSDFSDKRAFWRFVKRRGLDSVCVRVPLIRAENTFPDLQFGGFQLIFLREY